MKPPRPRERTNPRLSRWERLLIPAISFLAWLLFRFASLTFRTEVVIGAEHAERLVTEQRPTILTFWHNRTFLCSPFVWRRLVREGVPLGVLVSLSRDGTLLARVAAKMGFRVIRGSATLGGVLALRGLHRALTRDGCSIITAADGSQGPLYDCKPGTLLLAQRSGASILPFSGAADRYWRLRSWDRLFIPKPFARIAVAVGEPIVVPAQSDPTDLQALTGELSTTLAALGQGAKEALAN